MHGDRGLRAHSLSAIDMFPALKLQQRAWLTTAPAQAEQALTDVTAAKRAGVRVPVKRTHEQRQSSIICRTIGEPILGRTWCVKLKRFATPQEIAKLALPRHTRKQIMISAKRRKRRAKRRARKALGLYDFGKARKFRVKVRTGR